MESKKILFITDIFGGLAGAERNLFEIAKRLNNKGYNPIICSLKTVKNGFFTGECKRCGLRTIDLNISRVYSPFVIPWIIKLLFLLKRENIRLILTYHEGADLIGVILSILSGIPAVSSRRDMGYKLTNRIITMYKLINPFFTKIISVSDAAKALIVKREGVHPFKIITVHNGADLDYFSQYVDSLEVKRRLNLSPDKPIVGMLAGYRQIKGHRFFIEAIPKVLRVIQDVQFIIVGGYFDEKGGRLKQDLMDLTEELGISDNVHFYNATPRVNEILKIMDVYVLPSLSEGFSNTLLEAMAAVRPVIATNVGGNPEAVEHGKTGLLVPPANPKALAETILTLLLDKGLAQRMGKEGRRRAEDIFILDTMVQDTKRVYEVAMESKRHLKRSLRKSLKLIVDNLLYKLRLVHLYLFLIDRTSSNKTIRILCYHKIEDEEDILDMSVSTAHFEKQLKAIKKFYKILPLSEAINLLKSNGPIPSNAVVITFDDGYKSLYDKAYPIVKKLGVPITVFLIATTIDNKMGIWHDTLCTAIDNANRREVSFDNRTVYTGDQYAKNSFKRDMVAKLKETNEHKKNEVINDLMLQLEKARDKENHRNNTFHLTREEIKEMSQNGVTFGSHTLTHPILNQTPTKLTKKEIIESKSILEKDLEIEIDSFAYPNGIYDNDLRNIVKEAGYRCALTLDFGANKPKNGDIYSLKRINIAESLCTDLFGRFSEPLFICEVLGLNKKLSSPLKFLINDIPPKN